jgi:hypothetical protein
MSFWACRPNEMSTFLDIAARCDTLGTYGLACGFLGDHVSGLVGVLVSVEELPRAVVRADTNGASGEARKVAATFWAPTRD